MIVLALAEVGVTQRFGWKGHCTELCFPDRGNDSTLSDQDTQHELMGFPPKIHVVIRLSLLKTWTLLESCFDLREEKLIYQVAACFRGEKISLPLKLIYSLSKYLSKSYSARGWQYMQ